jgi:hypothetical protein
MMCESNGALAGLPTLLAPLADGNVLASGAGARANGDVLASGANARAKGDVLASRAGARDNDAVLALGGNARAVSFDAGVDARVQVSICMQNVCQSLPVS